MLMNIIATKIVGINSLKFKVTLKSFGLRKNLKRLSKIRSKPQLRNPTKIKLPRIFPVTEKIVSTFLLCTNGTKRHKISRGINATELPNRSSQGSRGSGLIAKMIAVRKTPNNDQRNPTMISEITRRNRVSRSPIVGVKKFLLTTVSAYSELAFLDANSTPYFGQQKLNSPNRDYQPSPSCEEGGARTHDDRIMSPGL